MAEITLEKIDMVKERTGVTYEEAKRYLEENNGSVIEAIVAIEREQRNSNTSESYRVPVNKVVEKVKELVKEGNVTRIRLKHEDRVILNLPLTLGVIAVVLAPFAAAVGTIAAVATHCTIEVERGERKQEE